MSTQSTQKYFCYICGREVIFKKGQYTTNKIGKIVAKRFNTDGTEHICAQTNQSSQRQTNNERAKRRPGSKNANYRDFGSSAQRMKERQEQYEKKRKAQEAYKKYRERYTSYYSQKSMSPLEALQILQLAEGVLALEFNKKVITITRAFWKLALRFHPARRHVSPEADEEKFRKIKYAYDSLLT